MLWLLLASALLPLALRTAWQARGSAGDDWKPAAIAAAGNTLREMLWLGLLGPPPGALLLWSWLLLAPGELPVPRRWARHWAACGCCAGYSRWLRRWPSVPGWGHCVPSSAAGLAGCWPLPPACCAPPRSAWAGPGWRTCAAGGGSCRWAGCRRCCWRSGRCAEHGRRPAALIRRLASGACLWRASVSLPCRDEPLPCR